MNKQRIGSSPLTKRIARRPLESLLRILGESADISKSRSRFLSGCCSGYQCSDSILFLRRSTEHTGNISTHNGLENQ